MSTALLVLLKGVIGWIRVRPVCSRGSPIKAIGMPLRKSAQQNNGTIFVASYKVILGAVPAAVTSAVVTSPVNQPCLPTNPVLQNSGGASGQDPEVLIIQNVTYEDEGWYTCVAGNNLGLTYSSAYLQVVDDLDPVVSEPLQQQSTLVKILAGVLCTMFLAGILIVIAISRKFKRQVHT
ncbi:hypothetical protein PR048_001742 [Dryococelus australis]|uniref:Immunoglobulin domain-containing protein n=1 Tax=Dryococelus australis TaxID=614101 RepID=A0ABQ9II73_9NEOP|nr:hypothetical protein PR048_001742 [Dryococelus australis]